MRPRQATPPRATRTPRTPRRSGFACPARGLAGVASGLALAAAVLALAATSLALAAPAAATTITEGTLARPFTFTPLAETLELIDGADQALRLRTTATLLLGPDSPLMQAYPGPDATADPRSVQVLPDGHLLVTDRERQVVAEMTAGGTLVWTYTHQDDAAFVRPFSARRFVAGGRELTLIADRWAARVFAVDMSKRVVWQYGKTDQPGLDVDQLSDPFFADYRDGRVLIADNNGGNRVLEIRYADYVEGAPDHGFTADSIVWQYGVAGEYGSAPGLLMKPRSPQRLDNGNVLICDADGQRVIEVRASDYDADAPDLGYTADSIVWQFGVTAEPGSDDLHLSDPTFAERLGTGATLIADTNNGRVLEVSRRGAILRRWDLRTIGRPGTATATDTAEPRAATLGLGGSLVTADTAFGQILDIGVAARAAASSVPLDGGRPATAKRWTRVAVEADLPSTTALVLDYSLDGQIWRTAALSDDLVAGLPVTTVGAALAYRVTLVTGTLRITPVVASVTLEYQAVADDGDTSTPTTVTAVPYDPDATAVGGTVTVTATGSTGTGTGSGLATGDGAGDGGTGTAAETGGSAADGALTAGTGADGAATAVSGYPMVAAGAGSAGAASAGIAADDEGAPSWPPLAALALAGAAVALVVLRAEREHRRLATLDHDAANDSSPAVGTVSPARAASRCEVTA